MVLNPLDYLDIVNANSIQGSLYQILMINDDTKAVLSNENMKVILNSQGSNQACY